MKPSNPIFSLAILSLAGLAACQSSSSTSPCDVTLPGNRVSAANTILSCFNTLDQTPVSQMPTTGSAVYNGYATGTVGVTPAVGMSPAVTDVIFGDAQMTANFTAGPGGTVTGTLDNFTSTAHGAMTGSVAIAGGTISGSTYSGATASGTFTNYGGTTLGITGASGGSFMGPNAGLLAATVTGTNTIGAGGAGPGGATALLIFAK